MGCSMNSGGGEMEGQFFEGAEEFRREGLVLLHCCTPLTGCSCEGLDNVICPRQNARVRKHNKAQAVSENEMYTYLK